MLITVALIYNPTFYITVLYLIIFVSLRLAANNFIVHYLTENQVFQFFVRATDTGVPPLHTDVPVQVYIMSPDDLPPLFQRSDHKFFLPENAPSGLCFLFLLIAL